MGPELIILPAFVLWCIGVFFFLRRMAARGEKSAAEPDPSGAGEQVVFVTRDADKLPQQDAVMVDVLAGGGYDAVADDLLAASAERLLSGFIPEDPGYAAARRARASSPAPSPSFPPTCWRGTPPSAGGSWSMAAPSTWS